LCAGRPTAASRYTNKNILTIALAVLVILPLSSMKNIGLLGYTSGFSITIIFFFTIVTIVAKYSSSIVEPCMPTEANPCQLEYFTV